MKIKVLFLALLTGVAVHAAEPAPQFTAVLSMGKENRFVLQAADGHSSPFIRIGDSFAGFSIKAFDAAKSVLTLERDGKTTNLTLATGGGIGSGAGSADPATAAGGTATEALALLNKIHFEQMIDQAIAQQKKSMAAMFQQLGNQPGMTAADKQDAIEFQNKMMDEVMAAMNPSQMKEDTARIYSETFSSAELQGIASFYDTPAGVALLAKQPEMQQKMSEIMVPRLTAAMPKIQQMARDFAMQQAAKKSAAAGGAAPAAP